MAAVQRKFDTGADTAVEETNAQITELIPTTISRTSPFRSPARDLQETLAQRLQEPAASNRDVAYGLITGVIGATWITAMLIYAVL